MRHPNRLRRNQQKRFVKTATRGKVVRYAHGCGLGCPICFPRIHGRLHRVSVAGRIHYGEIERYS